LVCFLLAIQFAFTDCKRRYRARRSRAAPPPENVHQHAGSARAVAGR
jgi:hypothetical protein